MGDLTPEAVQLQRELAEAKSTRQAVEEELAEQNQKMNTLAGDYATLDAENKRLREQMAALAAAPSAEQRLDADREALTDE